MAFVKVNRGDRPRKSQLIAPYLPPGRQTVPIGTGLVILGGSAKEKLSGIVNPDPIGLNDLDAS